MVLGYLPSLPLAASSLLLSVGLLATFPELMIAGRGMKWPVMLVQGLGALPLVHRIVREAIFRIPVSLVRTAKSFGATPFQIATKVASPLISTALLSGLLVGMASSLGEVAAVLLFSPGEVSTLSVELFRSVSRYQLAEGFSMALILVALLSALTIAATLVQRRAQWR
jgi:thiamine transport system permease protein